MPDLDSQVAALGIAFIELAKMLGKQGVIDVSQLATAIDTSAKGMQNKRETLAAAAELARRLVN